ncbi:MAG: asparagine synthase (glutamine-hydrolyzing) [Acidobacteria bacterium]|nr:asparagine synthase (glutamine-hydrolyzing) [Acidobacteriota bacterium]
MCGIAGIVNSDRSEPVDSAAIHRMCQAIVHRGPDDEGILVKQNTGLGMRRLSIIDVAGGHQPVFNEDRSIWIVFNGEIYNFPALRPGLEAAGHRFSTRSDTEVIGHLYEEMGAACVEKLRGMFAFALYDERQRKLLIARDRLGKKPLHYAHAGGRLLFASEIKSILAVAPGLAELNRDALLEYLYFGYILEPHTAFKAIQKLPAGHLLEFSDDEVRIRQYWDLPEYSTHKPASEEECLEQLEARLAEAVKLRLISDVPLGALLSGGTDSSTVVALMARATARPVKTFSIGFRVADFNEADYARLVARRFGTEHHELILEPDVVGTVEKLTSSLEEPFGDSSMLPTYYISCLARQHVTVALSGDGGDEIFAGYDRYAVQSRRQIFQRVPGWAWKWYREHVFPRIPHGVYGRNLSYNVSLPWQERYVDEIGFLPAFERSTPLLSNEFRASVAGNADPRNLMFYYLQNPRASDPLSKLLYLDTKTYLIGDILTKVDRMSMATSLEVRVPLLDHELVEWVTALEPEWKMRGRRQKYILRKLAERVGVPREVLDRPKQGFALPLVHWMRHELKDLIQSVLLDAKTIERGYFRRAAVAQLLDEHFRERRNHAGRIWRLLILELWHRNFLERLPAQASARECQPANSVRGGTA